jgi:transposase InsO family protein
VPDADVLPQPNEPTNRVAAPAPNQQVKPGDIVLGTDRVQTCRHEVLNHTLIWNDRHLMHALREFEQYYNEHRPHRTLGQAAPLRALPEPVTDPDRITRLDVRRHDRLAGVLNEYRHAA